MLHLSFDYRTLALMNIFVGWGSHVGGCVGAQSFKMLNLSISESAFNLLCCGVLQTGLCGLWRWHFRFKGENQMILYNIISL